RRLLRLLTWPVAIIGVWILDLLWILDLGSWILFRSRFHWALERFSGPFYRRLRRLVGECDITHLPQTGLRQQHPMRVTARLVGVTARAGERMDVPVPKIGRRRIGRELHPPGDVRATVSAPLIERVDAAGRHVMPRIGLQVEVPIVGVIPHQQRWRGTEGLRV